MRASQFSYSWYRSLLQHARNNSQIFTFSEWNQRNGILFRHDVDLDLGLALRMAEVEHELNIKATYFVMTCCEFYSPLSQHNRAMLRAMIDMGHEIGLHFNPSFHENEKDQQRAAIFAAEILSEACGHDVRALSLHCPSLHGSFPLFDGFINAYEPSIFSPTNYLSDSLRNFRGKDPFKWIEKGKTMTVQLLLHPMHYSESGSGYRTMLRNKIMHGVERLDAYFQVNSTYVDEMKGTALSNGLKWEE